MITKHVTRTIKIGFHDQKEKIIFQFYDTFLSTYSTILWNIFC